jgi:hypothetical protein
VWFYLRGEEYSAELDYFVRSATDRLEAGEAAGLNDFTSASRTDRVIEMLIADASAARIAVPGAGERPDRPEAARDRSRAAAASLKRRLLARSDWRRGVR